MVLAAAALVVAVIALVRQPATPSNQSAPSTAPTTSVAPADTTGADRSLCQAIAPLMAENDKISNAYVDTGDAGTPARDAAIPKYVADTQDWARRIQPMLDSHSDAQPFLRRTLQRFIDDEKLLVGNLRPGAAQDYDKEAYSDSMTAYGGPLSICRQLGVKW